jgi:hypothetical protein
MLPEFQLRPIIVSTWCFLMVVSLFKTALITGGIRDDTHGHVGRGEPADVIDVAGDPEVGQQDPLLVIVVIEMGEHDVGRFDVAVQQALLVGVVQRTGHGGDDAQDLIGWHSRGEPAGEKASRSGSTPPSASWTATSRSAHG